MNMEYKGFMENVVTFEAQNDVKKGDLVKVVESGKVAPCAEGDKICGVCMNVNSGYAAVQVGGFVNLPVNGVVSTGFVKICATGDGKAQTNENGREVLCITTDEGSAGFIL